jgi:hypothetical protein
VDKTVVLIVDLDQMERRFLTTCDINDRKRIAARLVILKQHKEIKDWGVFPVDTIARGDLKEMLGIL